MLSLAHRFEMFKFLRLNTVMSNDVFSHCILNVLQKLGPSAEHMLLQFIWWHIHISKKAHSGSEVYLCLWFQHMMVHHTVEITAVCSTSHPASQSCHICHLLPASVLWELWWFLRGSNNGMLRKCGCDRHSLFIDEGWKEQARGMRVEEVYWSCPGRMCC